jgi:hypothetical protein
MHSVTLNLAHSSGADLPHQGKKGKGKQGGVLEDKSRADSCANLPWYESHLPFQFGKEWRSVRFNILSYRVEKYRPHTLSELVSHQQITSSILRFIEQKKLPHLLFYGPPGTGKTSTILACARQMYGVQYKSMILEVFIIFKQHAVINFIKAPFSIRS